MKKKLLLFIASAFSCFAFSQTTDLCYPENLSCEYLTNPLGMDSPNPRLSWMIKDGRQGSLQTAYRIVVGSDSIQVLNGKADCWDSQKINSDRILTSYEGKKLSPFTPYYWKVMVWDKDGEMSSSKISSFETGMMGMHNWQGTWISDGQDINHKPAPYFRKTFDTKSPIKSIKSAKAYIAVAGLYELFINGSKIGNHRLDPMYTRFDRRNLYVTYDVTTQLQEGKNAIGVILGNGWYNHQSHAVWDFDRAPWRNRPAFCMDLRITYIDGSTQTIVSERDWKTDAGPIVFNSIYTAEHYDARLEQKGWNTASFDDAKWKGVYYRAVPSQNVVSQQMQPIRNVETIVPQSIKKMNDTTYVFDLGRNIAGVSQLKASGERGTIVRIKHGERLYTNGHNDGHVDLSNIDVYHRPKDNTDVFQTDVLILSGEDQDEFMPKFNYKGFRYVEVISSKPIDLNINSLTGFFMHSDVASKGEIKTSNTLVNKLWRATNNAYLSNLFGFPTDCPQREKNGWTGDGHFAIETGLYNFDGITIYEKWLADHRDEQQPNGVLPDIIPTGGWGYGTANGVDWTSTIAIIPWEIYMFYGDSKLLSDCYDNIKSYVNYIDRTSPSGLTAWGRGDWVPVKTESSLELTSSIYFYVDASILAKAAKLFGKADDYKHYAELADKIKDAINAKYLNKETGIYANGSQTELSVPLQWGIVPDGYKAKVAQSLAKKVEEAGFHLDVGVLGAKAILNALSENGYAETAYKVAAQDTYPSWGWWIANGATTLLENWDLDAKRDISDNHMMFGEVGGWFFKGLGGIKPDPQKPGFKHIVLRPNFVSGLNQFEATHNSPYGEIVSAWSRKKNTITYSLEIPANSSATFYLPEDAEAQGALKSQRVIELSAGKHILKLNQKGKP
ncbi:alpha-rhamnosidase [Bacteroidales bacterium]|nr:alpha-rhamnosidase [Bacteroidales bacterium]